MNDVFKKINWYLSDNLESNTTLKRKKSVFRIVFSGIRENVKEVENDQKPTPLNNDQVKETITYLTDLVMYDPINEQLAEFIKNWTYLVYNWNENILYDNNIRKKCEVLERLVDNYVSMKEVSETMKELNKRLKHFRSWNPPAFEISKSFINYLEE